MENVDIVRAWKDEKYRQSLSQEQLSKLPEHPAGMIELTELELDRVAGGGTVLGSYCVCVM